MADCMTCKFLQFPRQVGSSVVMQCGKGFWVWDRLRDQHPINKMSRNTECTEWELRIAELEGSEKEQ